MLICTLIANISKEIASDKITFGSLLSMVTEKVANFVLKNTTKKGLTTYLIILNLMRIFNLQKLNF